MMVKKISQLKLLYLVLVSAEAAVRRGSSN